ncbi:MAG: gamma-glutamyl-gamma-aminobutyrate hydrolase family protein [Candidatus Riflebacteria bacterium]|nr:gamma-glutamyl-gamma-aminobutyrate hydrolase family protein [Candidatus Riflebacteria bacterium]
MKEGSLLKDAVGNNKALAVSLHHQAVKKLGKGLVVTAHGKDGIIEAIERENFLILTYFDAIIMEQSLWKEARFRQNFLSEYLLQI